MSQSLHLLNHASTPNLTFPSNTKQCYSYLPKPSSTYNRRFPLISIRASSSDLDSSSPLLVSDNGKGTVISREEEYPVAAGSTEVDAVTETELKENGFRSTRRTKLVCTIGPSTCGFDQLESLVVWGFEFNFFGFKFARLQDTLHHQPSTMSSSTSSYALGNPWMHFCHWGTRAPVKSSWTGGSVERRFWACEKYRVDDTCGYFAWLDPPTCALGTELLPLLREKIDSLEKEVAAAHAKEIKISPTFTFISSTIFGFCLIIVFWVLFIG